MPEDGSDDRILGRMEEQLAGLRRDYQQMRENVIRIRESLEKLRAEFLEGIFPPLKVHETRIKILEHRMDALWPRGIGIITLVSSVIMLIGGFMAWIFGLLKGH